MKASGLVSLWGGQCTCMMFVHTCIAFQAAEDRMMDHIRAEDGAEMVAAAAQQEDDVALVQAIAEGDHRQSGGLVGRRIVPLHDPAPVAPVHDVGLVLLPLDQFQVMWVQHVNLLRAARPLFPSGRVP